MDFEFWTSGAGGAIIYAAVKYFWDRSKSNKERKDAREELASKELAIYQWMNKTLQNTPVKRIIISKVENGGRFPDFHGELKMSDIYYDCSEPFTNCANYDSVEVDGGYEKVLKEMRVFEPLTIHPHSMPASMIKNLYLANGVSFIQYYFLTERPNAFFFVSLGTDAAGVEQMKTPFHQVDLQIKVSELRNVFKTINF